MASKYIGRTGLEILPFGSIRACLTYYPLNANRIGMCLALHQKCSVPAHLKALRQQTNSIV
jgi:hypothetical protein